MIPITTLRDRVPGPLHSNRLIMLVCANAQSADLPKTARRITEDSLVSFDKQGTVEAQEIPGSRLLPGSDYLHGICPFPIPRVFLLFIGILITFYLLVL